MIHGKAEAFPLKTAFGVRERLCFSAFSALDSDVYKAQNNGKEDMLNLSNNNLFRLRKRLHEKLEARLESVPLFNVLLIAVLLMLTGSRFVFAPGLPIALSPDASGEFSKTVSGGTPELVLPETATVLPGVATSSVLTVKSDSMFVFDGHIYDRLEDVFSEKNRLLVERESNGILLVKLDRAVSVQGLFKIAELAGKAGFSSLQIAGESPSYRPTNIR